MNLVISNIPAEFRTPDLRNYFHEFIIKTSFECFHFRHRPETLFWKEINKEKDILKSNYATENEVSKNLDVNNRNSLKYLINSSKVKFNHQNSTENNKCKNNDERNTPNHSSNSTCCVIRIKDVYTDIFIKSYNGKHWVDKEGDPMIDKCMLFNLDNLPKFDSENGNVCSFHGEKGQSLGISNYINNMIEMQPPPAMPNGNVGTTEEYFKEQIKLCLFPPVLIKKLGLDFKRQKRKKRFGEVPFSYNTNVSQGSTDEGIVFTSTGDLIPSSYYIKNPKSKNTSEAPTGPIITPIEEPDEDGDDVEEWERHEAFYDNVNKQSRDKERLFEEDIELQWEKGGSGLVFYTDAQYWRAQEGDFDERTANEWDVDMSGYYHPGSGDMDAQDSISMVHSSRLRDGTLHQSVFSQLNDSNSKDKTHNMKKKKSKPSKIGKFEAHTRGFGRKVMEAQGWSDGKKLGRGDRGLSEALENDGQHPKDKRGFGYYGPKEPDVTNSKKFKKREKIHHDEETVYIGTAFDNPNISDPNPHPLRRPEYTILSHFDMLNKKIFKKGTE